MDTTELATSLRSAISALHKGLRKQASSVEAYSMTELETIALLVRNAALLPSELALLTRITTQSMSGILKKMEGQGIIKRTPSHEDKRKVYISLTPAAKKMVERRVYDKDEWLKGAIEKSLTVKEQELLAKVLPVLNKLVAIKY